MCEILVRAVDGISIDPASNPLRGMPVVVMPDGHAWGSGERLPEYIIIKLPSVPVSDIKQYVSRWETVTTNVDAPPTVTMFGRRRYLVPETVIRLAESSGGTYTVTRNQFTVALIDRAI